MRAGSGGVKDRAEGTVEAKAGGGTGVIYNLACAAACQIWRSRLCAAFFVRAARCNPVEPFLLPPIASWRRRYRSQKNLSKPLRFNVLNRRGGYVRAAASEGLTFLAYLSDVIIDFYFPVITGSPSDHAPLFNIQYRTSEP